MRRRFEDSEKVIYHIDCDYIAESGALRVVVDGIYVGDVVNGVCEWESKPYKKDVVVTIENAVQKKEESQYYTPGCVYKRMGTTLSTTVVFPNNTAYLNYNAYAFFVDVLVKSTATYTPKSATIRVGVYNISINYERPAVVVEPEREPNYQIIYKTGDYSISSIYPDDGNVQNIDNTSCYIYPTVGQGGITYTISINDNIYYDFNAVYE